MAGEREPPELGGEDGPVRSAVRALCPEVELGDDAVDGDRVEPAVARERGTGAEDGGGVDVRVARGEVELEPERFGDGLVAGEGDDLERAGVEPADGELERGRVGAELGERHGADGSAGAHGTTAASGLSAPASDGERSCDHSGGRRQAEDVDARGQCAGGDGERGPAAGRPVVDDGDLAAERVVDHGSGGG